MYIHPWFDRKINIWSCLPFLPPSLYLHLNYAWLSLLLLLLLLLLIGFTSRRRLLWLHAAHVYLTGCIRVHLCRHKLCSCRHCPASQRDPSAWTAALRRGERGRVWMKFAFKIVVKEKRLLRNWVNNKPPFAYLECFLKSCPELAVEVGID